MMSKKTNLWCRIHHAKVQIFNTLHDFWRQLSVPSVDIFFKLIHRGCANNGAGDKPAVIHKTQSHLRWREAMSPCKFGISLACSSDIWFFVALGITQKHGDTPLCFGVVDKFASEVSKRQW